jgi:hypothetical protein
MNRPEEKILYPIVEKWLKRHYRCFKTFINKGLIYSRIDVGGVRDVGGDLSGEVESIVVEVKRGTEPFATASGQALGYRVYANRVYLADLRESRFSLDEINIAGHLGIGLIQIKGKKCYEILSSPHYRPITKLNYALMEKLALGWCQLCNCMFEIGKTTNSWSKLTKKNLQYASDREQGVIFWNYEVAERKRRLGIREIEKGFTHERRFLCPDCVDHLLSQFKW